MSFTLVPGHDCYRGGRAGDKDGEFSRRRSPRPNRRFDPSDQGLSAAGGKRQKGGE